LSILYLGKSKKEMKGKSVIIIKPILLIGLLVITCLLMGCAAFPGNRTDKVLAEQKQNLEEKWGIQIESLRLSAADNLLDFRYRIIDPDKALPLVERKNKPYLIDQESGKTLGVPSGAKVGPLRQTVRYGKPKEDRVYFVLFGNPGGFVKPGNKVTVVIGDFRAENLVVE
jgi:hypothetical protein